MTDLDQSPALPYDYTSEGPTEGWVKNYSPAGGFSPGGANGQVQFNNGGVFGGLSGTQLTALLDTFTNALKGIVPPSTGTVTDFLRADGTWAVPPGSSGGIPGGSNSEIQFNSGGAFGGLTDIQVTARIQPFTSIASGAAPASGGGTTNFLRADGTWAPSGNAGNPAGADTQVQFNDGGVFGADAGMTYAKASDALSILGSVISPLIIGGILDSSVLTLESTSIAGATDYIIFKTRSQVERLRITDKVLIGGVSVQTASFAQMIFQINGTGFQDSGFNVSRWANNSAGPSIVFAKSRGGGVGTHAAVQDNDALGQYQFQGDDGTNIMTAAQVQSAVDGTVSTGIVPGRLEFSTTDAAGVNAVRWRLNSVGFTSILGGSFGRAAPIIKTADFTVATNENWLINNKAGSTCTVTLPVASTCPGRELMITNWQAQTVVSVASDVVPQTGGAASTAILAGTAGKWAILVNDGTNWIITISN